MLDAVRLVASSGRAFHVVVVGEGPLARSELKARASAGWPIVFPSSASDPNGSNLAAAFDIAVLTSDREGMPLSLLEYMALGLAIVATAVGGIPEVITDEREGLLVAPGNAEQVAAAITRLLDAPEERLKLGSAAARRQAAEYDLDSTVRQIESLYVELIEGRTA